MKIIIQNLAIEYADAGAGKIILCLHGWQDNLHTFDNLVSTLSVANRIIRLNLPGFGESEMPKESWCLDDYVGLVKNFIQKLNLDIDIIIGHSFGGRIAIKGAATNQLASAKIILIGSAGLAKGRTGRNVSYKIISKLAGIIAYIPPVLFWRNNLRRKMYKMIGSDYLAAGPLKKTFLNIISEDLSDSAKKITQPTLLIWGEDDTETPLSDGKKMASIIPNSKLEVIKNAGHFVHKEKTAEVAESIRKFL